MTARKTLYYKEGIVLRYPPSLRTGDTIGICAPSSGLPDDKNLQRRLDSAKSNVEALGYNIIESNSVRQTKKCVSADASIRAAEFTKLYEDPEVSAIIPPWGGEFLMDMLPYLDFKRLQTFPPTWFCGYSDTSLLCFALTIHCDTSTIHGSAFMNFGYKEIHESDLKSFELMKNREIVQQSAPYWGTYSGQDTSKQIYDLTSKSTWKSLDKHETHTFSGRMIGGCMDVIHPIIGTRFDVPKSFLEKYKDDGFIWTLESCEMTSADIYRTLWQMQEAGWFKYCNGFLIGRPGGYKQTEDFTMVDALTQGLGKLKVPVIYDADIGHIPPQMQILNGAYGTVVYKNGKAEVSQQMKP